MASVRAFARSAWIVASVIVSLGVPRSAAAQFDALTELAKSFTDITLQYNVLEPRVGTFPSVRTVGAEFLFTIRELRTPICLSGEKLCEGIASTESARSCAHEEKLTGREVLRREGRVETTDILTLTEGKCVPPRSRRDGTIEFAAGYSRSNRLVIVEGGDVITGNLVEQPSFAFYYTNYASRSDCGRLLYSLKPACIDYYLGLKSGWVEFAGLKLTTGGESFTAPAKVVQLGGAVGLVADVLPPLSLFVELGYVARDFADVTWTRGTVPGPATARTELDFTSAWVGLGFQIQVRTPK